MSIKRKNEARKAKEEGRRESDVKVKTFVALVNPKLDS